MLKTTFASGTTEWVTLEVLTGELAKKKVVQMKFLSNNHGEGKNFLLREFLDKIGITKEDCIKAFEEKS